MSCCPFSHYGCISGVLQGKTNADEVMRMRQGERRGGVGQESINPYFEGAKYPEPTVCPRCGLMYQTGRWQVVEKPSGKPAHRHHCPACRRAIDRYPAGWVYLSGDYMTAHREEILSIARNQESAAAASRPLQRILWIEQQAERVEIATTNRHLAERIGKAIEGACKGTLQVKRAPNAPLARVYWERNSF